MATQWNAPKRPQSALVIVGHGSTENEDSSTPIYEHARALRDSGLFAEVHTCFWKEEPSMRDVWLMSACEHVIIVPDFISEGYFTQEILPRELELDGPITQKAGRTVWYTPPVGVHPRAGSILLERAQSIAPELDPRDTSLLIVGHGTQLNAQSLDVVVAAANELSQKLPYAQVLATSMEEDPKIENWHELATEDTVVVVPFFISDGLHSYQDIPVLLGIEKEPSLAASKQSVFRDNPYHLRGKTLYYSSAIGTAPDFAQIILDQIASFEASHGLQSGCPQSA